MKLIENPVTVEKQGKICKIRGQAYITKVTPSLAYRVIDAAKKMLHGYISDVYITVDHRKGDVGGNDFSSPGYGLFLTAETTEGVIYHGEAISKPKGEAGDPSVAEDVGTHAAVALLEEIYKDSLTHRLRQLILHNDHYKLVFKTSLTLALSQY
ncbi:RNA 3-prime-terminal phosphate cyclase, insert domain protein [Dictyocaulus viviparus]|uniref:RNA 3-prime-terminal phosphate cyclase, insert domain protein n=1 Tax=Dictyocaulus viviparus TaxID=29172 RepID=A0A0D8X8H2_DICVI|nr:RNA 3-prime-terminal phosphate cyclase, insert domain protein [Dictyocaulus viviparus]